MENTRNQRGVRIAVTGPECSGKTTLARELAVWLHGEFVEEHARLYLNRISRPYVSEDLIRIGREQQRQWEDVESVEIMVADTEWTVIKIWYEHKFGTCPEEIIQRWNQQNFDAYLLCYPDLPWEPDPLRESPEEEERLQLFQKYEDALNRLNVPWYVIRGKGNDRFRIAQKALHEMLPDFSTSFR